jgi:hypothetical protein
LEERVASAQARLRVWSLYGAHAMHARAHDRR